MSRAEMSAGYQEWKISNGQSSASKAATISRPASVSNPWNECQRAHVGSGLSRSEMSANYQAVKAADASIRINDPTPAIFFSPRTESVSWNEFQHQHAGHGLSNRQVSLLYKQQSDLSASTPAATVQLKGTSATQTKPTSASAKPERRANPFNEFQKQYKRDHPGEKLNSKQLAKLYREQQREQILAAFDTKAPDAPLAERLRQQVEEMLLNLAMMQEQSDMPLSERDEWGHVARQLEWEEGNYNRQKIVESRDQTRVSAAHDVEGLQKCEFIESGRLELTLKDDARIGSGGFGVVYAATMDKEIAVAVKVIDSVSTKSKKLFEQEMLAMMKASAHENVLRVHGYTVLSSESGRQSFGIVTEFMGGGDLAFALYRAESCELSVGERLQLLLQVIKAIEYIHSQGITHRDIKPHNVLLSSDRQTAKLADFGLAGFKNTTLATQQSRTTTKDGDTTMVLGLTPAYAAPEVFEGKLSFRDQAWKKSDVFSFTVLLTEVLMETQPWEFETPQYMMNSVCKLQKRPFELDDFLAFGGESCSSKLRALVQDGWHQDPGLRPTAKDMRERLEKVISAEETARVSASEASKSVAAIRTGSLSPRGVDGN